MNDIVVLLVAIISACVGGFIVEKAGGANILSVLAAFISAFIVTELLR